MVSFSSVQFRFSQLCQGNTARSGEVPTRGRHNSSWPSGAKERVWYWWNVERSLPGAVTIRLCPPGATEGVRYWRNVERSLPGAVTIRLCPPEATEGVRYWRKVERSLPGAVTIRPCPPGAKEEVGQFQELERSLNWSHHGLSLPNRTKVNTSRSPDTWKEPTYSMEPNEGWRSQELRSTLQRRTNIPAQICRVVELPGYFKNDYTQCRSSIYELCVFMLLYSVWR